MNCGECTLCCKLLETHGAYSSIGEYCKHCDIGKGCKIYETRFQECKDYQCMWSQMENVGLEVRPDKCGIIFDKVNDQVLHARQDEKISNDYTSRQIISFIRQGYSVVLLKGEKRSVFLSRGHTVELVEKAIKKWQHRVTQKI